VSKDLDFQALTRWVFKRNCSIRPKQLLIFYASICLISLGIATWFFVRGASLVLPFAVLEVAAVGAAFLIYARHAADCERIELSDREMRIEVSNGAREASVRLPLAAVRIEQQGRALLAVSGAGERAEIGRFVRPHLRAALARELQAAVRAQRMAGIS
jgi:uncharacterized membrane protein